MSSYCNIKYVTVIIVLVISYIEMHFHHLKENKLFLTKSKTDFKELFITFEF